VIYSTHKTSMKKIAEQAKELIKNAKTIAIF
jgi:hypothetical protein